MKGEKLDITAEGDVLLGNLSHATYKDEIQALIEGYGLWYEVSHHIRIPKRKKAYCVLTKSRAIDHGSAHETGEGAISIGYLDGMLFGGNRLTVKQKPIYKKNQRQNKARKG